MILIDGYVYEFEKSVTTSDSRSKMTLVKRGPVNKAYQKGKGRARKR